MEGAWLRRTQAKEGAEKSREAIARVVLGPIVQQFDDDITWCSAFGKDRSAGTV